MGTYAIIAKKGVDAYARVAKIGSGRLLRGGCLLEIVQYIDTAMEDKKSIYSVAVVTLYTTLCSTPTTSLPLLLPPLQHELSLLERHYEELEEYSRQVEEALRDAEDSEWTEERERESDVHSLIDGGSICIISAYTHTQI